MRPTWSPRCCWSLGAGSKPWPRDDDEAVRWLYGVARRALANHRRGRGRRHALTERLRLELGRVERRAPAGDLQTIRESLEALGADDRELLTLIAWEGLTGVEAARALGIRPATARKRLERARGACRTS